MSNYLRKHNNGSKRKNNTFSRNKYANPTQFLDLDLTQNPSESSLHQMIDNEYFEAMSALDGSNRIAVYVEGYEDIAFWRNVFDEFTTPTRKFQIMTPARADLAKGKKVVLGFAEKAGPKLILCVDSDFDYLFPDNNNQALKVNNCKYLVQTYAYAIENLQAYPPSLQSLAVKAAKVDREIFDFPKFFRDYSQIIYPAFLWYAYAARESRPEIFSLTDFRNTVKINYLDITDNGYQTLLWLNRQVSRRVAALQTHFPDSSTGLSSVEDRLREMNISPGETYLYMQGHTLLDNVVKVVLAGVCDNLRRGMLSVLDDSRVGSLSQRNQISYYNNSLVELDQLLSDNRGYMKGEVYGLISGRINDVLSRC